MFSSTQKQTTQTNTADFQINKQPISSPIRLQPQPELTSISVSPLPQQFFPIQSRTQPQVVSYVVPTPIPIPEQKPMCVFHHGNVITNICVHPECLLPLCQYCIPDHFKIHESHRVMPQIEAIDIVRKSTRNALHNQLQELQQIILRQNAMITNPPVQDNHILTLNQARNKVLTIVNNYFDQLDREINYALHQQTVSGGSQLSSSNVYLASIQQELVDTINRIDAPLYIKPLLQAMQPEFQRKTDFRQVDLDIVNRIPDFKVEVDEQKLYSINLELGNYIRISQSRPFIPPPNRYIDEPRYEPRRYVDEPPRERIRTRSIEYSPQRYSQNPYNSRYY